MELGWCAYDMELGDPAHVAAVARLRPQVIRWFVSVDRHVYSNSATAFPWEARYGAALQTIADAGCTLVVQFQMKRPDWTAGDAGNTVGASGWKAGPRLGWPADPAAKWLPFVDTCLAAVAAHGVTPAGVGAWNEPDWRLCWAWESRTAPSVEWQMGQFLWMAAPPSHAFGWTGGHSRLKDLRSRRPLVWTSDGVGDHDPTGWLALSAADPTISMIDVHTYQGGRIEDDLARVGRVVDAFDNARSEKLPVVVGEYGDDPNGSPYSTEWRDRALQFAARLESRYPARLVGVAAHLQGVRQGVTYPPLWQSI